MELFREVGRQWQDFRLFQHKTAGSGFLNGHLSISYNGTAKVNRFRRVPTAGRSLRPFVEEFLELVSENGHGLRRHGDHIFATLLFEALDDGREFLNQLM